MKFLMLFVVLALAGCVTSPPRVEIQKVEVPISVPCIKRARVPVEPMSKFALVGKTAPMDDQVRALLIDRESNTLYGKRVRALVEACVITDATTSADLAPSPVKP